MSDCIFCKIARGEMNSEIVWEDDQTLAFRDISPQAPSHILIIPRKHISSLKDAKPEDEAVLGRLMLAASEVAKSEGIGDAFRVVVNSGAAAGQSVFHIHLHLLGGRRLGWPPG